MYYSLSVSLHWSALEVRIFTPSVRPTVGLPNPRGRCQCDVHAERGRGGETLAANHLRAHGLTTPFLWLSHGRLEWIQQGLVEHDRLWLAARRTQSLLEQCHLCGWTAGNYSTERKPWKYSRLPNCIPFTRAVQPATLYYSVSSVVLSPWGFYTSGFTFTPLSVQDFVILVAHHFFLIQIKVKVKL